MRYPLVCAVALILNCSTTAGRKQRISVECPATSRKYIATVILPEAYQHESSRRWPVIYLLHGHAKSHTEWPRIAPVKQYADTYRIIFVSLDGKRNSWYLDSPVNPESQFSTCFTEAIIPGVDSLFRTHDRAAGRGLIGSSMGGHGAVTLLAQHPDLFAGAGSIAGIMDLLEFAGKWELPRILGNPQAHPERYRQASFVGTFDRLKGEDKLIILDCGVQDFALPGNRKAHKLLLEAGIAHEYYERFGDHTPAYVRHSVESHILMLSKKMLPVR
ncbi:MAG: prolyl oligopeptidase family serine peptidase [Chitinivibrionales bacterium]|nr:prolyl oligopeptidase family serine peptidase [Chitinivibrionales bacterium]